MAALAVQEHHKRSIRRVPMIIWQVWTCVFSTNLPEPGDWLHLCFLACRFARPSESA